MRLFVQVCRNHTEFELCSDGKWITWGSFAPERRTDAVSLRDHMRVSIERNGGKAHVRIKEGMSRAEMSAWFISRGVEEGSADLYDFLDQYATYSGEEMEEVYESIHGSMA